MNELVSYEVHDDVAVITINNPPVNALSPGVPEGIRAGIELGLADKRIRAFVLIGGGRTFVVGADIKEFQKMTSELRKRDQWFHDTIDVIEQASKPVICAIHGTALGGGLEIAMACHYRVASTKARVGQPEVHLGVIPGAGGTQRLPRLAGILMAADMCATGRMVEAAEAHAAGIIDQLIDDDLDLLQCAIEFTRQEANTPPRRTRDLEARFEDVTSNQTAIAELEKQVGIRMRGRQAPFRAIECVRMAREVPFDEAIRRESEIFDKCLFSDESKALVHIFFGERTVRKVPGISPETAVGTIRKAAIIGAGTMGGGIAMTYANAGIPVVLKEVKQEYLDRGLAVMRGNWERRVKKGKMSQEEVEERIALITPTLDYTDIEDADIVVEAVFENMELKKKVFAQLDEAAPGHAVLASNTSTLNIDEIAAATCRPQQVIGHHFFSPANIMRLLEIVRGRETSAEVIATSMALARRLRKVGVLVGNCFGFVGNRMFMPYTREASFLVEEGAALEVVDATMYEFGMAMGPLAVEDLAGIDVGWRIRQEFPNLEGEGGRTPLMLSRLVEAGRLGQKAGAGWYRYPEGSRQREVEPEVLAMVREAVAEAGIRQREISPKEIVERTVYALVNVGAELLEEGIALRSVDIDVVYVFGYGFPAWRGGPMKYADTVGLNVVHDRVCNLHQEHGDAWRPAPLLARLAAEGRTFADFDRTQSHHSGGTNG